MLELDADVAEIVAMFPLGTVNAETLQAVRQADLGPAPELSDQVVRHDHVVPGDPEVVVRVYRPVGLEGPLPCVFWIHGGGYVLGSYSMEDARFDSWCLAYGAVGVSVDYRLAPESPYPAALEDCYSALRWVWRSHENLAVNPDRIGIAGISAGGGLAAALAILARDRGEVPLIFQLLECPMLDDRQVTPSSRLEGLAIWNRESNEFGWRSYLGDLYGSPDVPGYAAASRATDLSGLPPAYVCVGALDGFRDENVEYAGRLNQAGVPTELHVYSGAPHAVGVFAGTSVGARYNRGLAEWLERQLS